MNKIFIIQDSPSINAILKFRLEPEGFSVDTVETGEEGIQKAAGFPYKLILVDINLPGINGLEVTRALKNNEALKDTPIILLSAKDEKELIRCVADAGADGYIGEPFEGKEIAKKIKAFIKDA